jgi:RimJ/RimL family protein N-acetyltransferase
MMHCVMDEEPSMQNVPVHQFTTRDGQRVWLRPVEKDDARHLVDLFQHMGPESRYLRFNLALDNPDPELVWAEAERLSQIDPETDGAWLAFTDLPDQPDAAVGGARYMGIGHAAAEASLAVRDDMQNKGIGTELLLFLVESARAAGILKLVAIVQRGNRPLWHLLQRSPWLVEYESEGSYSTITVHLDRVGREEAR